MFAHVGLQSKVAGKMLFGKWTAGTTEGLGELIQQTKARSRDGAGMAGGAQTQSTVQNSSRRLQSNHSSADNKDENPKGTTRKKKSEQGHLVPTTLVRRKDITLVPFATSASESKSTYIY